MEVNCMTESTIAGHQTRTAGLFSGTHGSKHLFRGGKSIISPPRCRRCIGQMRKLAHLDATLTWPVLWLRYKVFLNAVDFSYLDRLPRYCVIEYPAPCHYTRAVWLLGRASASSSGPALNSLRQALADCSETENPWLAENNKYPWEAARWTFTVSLAGEGEICQTSQ